MGDLAVWQYATFAVAFFVSSLLSIIGSSTIIFLLYKDCAKVYHRILFMISIGDLVLSISNLVHGFFLPKDKTDSPFAIGNDGTCSFVGFILNASLLFVSIYNAFISLNFYFQVRFKWNDQQISKWYLEGIVHVLAFVISLSIPTAGVATNSMSPSYESGLCLMTTYPRGCVAEEDIDDAAASALDNNDPNAQEEDIVICERGVFGAKYLSTTVSGLIYFFGLIGFGCTFALYWTVRNAIRSAAKQHTEDEFQTIDQRQQERMSRVSRQCTLFALAYLNTIIWPAAIQVVFRAMNAEGRRGEPILYTLRLVALLCFPLQGFLNFLVFISPKYQLWRQAMPEEPWTYVLRRALSNTNPPAMSGSYITSNRNNTNNRRTTTVNNKKSKNNTNDNNSSTGIRTFIPRRTRSNGSVDHSTGSIPLPTGAIQRIREREERNRREDAQERRRQQQEEGDHPIRSSIGGVDNVPTQTKSNAVMSTPIGGVMELQPTIHRDDALVVGERNDSHHNNDIVANATPPVRRTSDSTISVVIDSDLDFSDSDSDE